MCCKPVSSNICILQLKIGRLTLQSYTSRQRSSLGLLLSSFIALQAVQPAIDASDNEPEEEEKAPHCYLSFLLSRSDLLAKYTCLSVL